MPSSADYPAVDAAAPLAPPARRPRRTFVLLLAASLIASAGALGVIMWADSGDDDAMVTPSKRYDSGRLAVGEPVPGFELEAVDGSTVRLDDYLGRPIVLTFFSSWCNPCEREMRVLEEAHNERPGDFAVVGVNFKDLDFDTRAFVKRLGVTFPALLDTDGAVRERYGVLGIPQVLFIDDQGLLRERAFGITTRKALAGPLERLLSV